MGLVDHAEPHERGSRQGRADRAGEGLPQRATKLRADRAAPGRRTGCLRDDAASQSRDSQRHRGAAADRGADLIEDWHQALLD